VRCGGFDEPVWVLFRESIVFAGNYARFSQNPEQRELLFSTRGTTLVEASPHDRVWGIGLSVDDPRALDRSQWLGLNLLGETLTRVREVLLFEYARAEQRRAEPVGAAPGSARVRYFFWRLAFSSGGRASSSVTDL
jgi:hypothetical protein